MISFFFSSLLIARISCRHNCLGYLSVHFGKDFGIPVVFHRRVCQFFLSDVGAADTDSLEEDFKVIASINLYRGDLIFS